MNNSNILNEEGLVSGCTSCQLCAAVCPTGAVKITFDEDGFYRPSVEVSKCINCGICAKNCYKYDTKVLMKNEYKNAWACKATQKQVLEKTTSGGIAYLLAEIAIKENYAVFGVGYDNELNRAVAKITDNDANQFIGSKYIQA